MSSDFPLVFAMTQKGRYLWLFCSLLYPWHQIYDLGHGNNMLNYLLKEYLRLKSGQKGPNYMRQVMLSDATVTDKSGNTSD